MTFRRSWLSSPLLDRLVDLYGIRSHIVRNRFLPWQNLLDQCRQFLDWFSWLRMVLYRNQRYVKNCQEISFLKFIKILYIVCSLNGNGKRPSAQLFENDEIVFHLVVMSQC